MVSRAALLLATLGVATAVAAGCGEVSGEAAPSGASVDPAWAAFDACTVLSEDELRGLGMQVPALEKIDQLGEVGCQFRGDPFALALRKSERELSFYEQRAEGYESYTPNQVAGRPGAAVVSVGTGSACTQVVEAGTGSVGVQVNYIFGRSGDPCGQALRIAEMIEPRLPEAKG